MSNDRDHHREIVAGLRSLPRLEPPPTLTSRLRVMGSREALRARRSASVASFAAYIREEVSLRFDNLMRPIALPVAGGIASSMLLFAVLAPGLTINRFPVGDIPTGLTTAGSLESSFSFDLGNQDFVVDVFVDEQGKVVDYSIPEGQNWAKNPMLVRRLENTLLFTKFTPATFFGQPSAGRSRITLRRSQLEVRG